MKYSEAKEDHVKLIDEAFIATWDKETGEAIQNKLTALRLGYLDDSFAKNFFELLDKSILHTWNDHTTPPPIDYLYSPIEVSYKYDKITDYGLSLFCALIVGKSVPLISHMGIGSGTADTFDYQDTLFTELVRYAFSDKGYINNLGRTLRFYMIFDIMLPSNDYAEIGLFNNPNIGVGPMIARSLFNPPISHVSGSDYVTGSYLITTLSA